MHVNRINKRLEDVEYTFRYNIINRDKTNFRLLCFPDGYHQTRNTLTKCCLHGSNIQT